MSQSIRRAVSRTNRLEWLTRVWQGRQLDWAVSLLLFAIALALYARTMAPGLLDGDEGEFQINIFRLGVSHTGYPTFFLLGKLWTLLVPIGTIATRANLFSAFWGALTIPALYLLVLFLTRNRWAGILSALLLLGSRVEWSQAVIPRPYTMNSLFVILVPFLFFLWRVGKVDLTVPVFAFSASLTNHRTTMWFGPAILLFVLIADYYSVFGRYSVKGDPLVVLREWLARSELFKPRRLLSLTIAFLLPLLLYGYVFWRGESDVGVEFHWKDFNDEILGGYVRASWRFGPFNWLVSRITDLYIPMLIEQFTVLGFIAGLIGGVALALDKPPRGWHSKLPARETFIFILLANLANTAFCVIFWVIDIDKFFLPSFITFLFFTGVGVAVISEWLTVNSKESTVNSQQSIFGGRHAPRTTHHTIPFTDHRSRFAVYSSLSTVYCLLFTGFVFLVITNFPLNDWSSRSDVAQAWDENLAQPLEPNAVIAGSWESITPLEYAMYVDGRRRDLERWKLITKNYQLGQVPYGSRQEDIEKAVRSGRPVYLTVYPGETETLRALVDEFRMVRVGDLWRVLNMPPANPTMVQKSTASEIPQVVFKNREGMDVELHDYEYSPGSNVRAGDLVVASLVWRAPQAFPGRLAISVRVKDAQDHLIVQRDSEPGNGLRPSSGWGAGEAIVDDIGFFIPPDTPPGDYALSLVVYDMASGENLQSSEGMVYPLRTLHVRPTSSAPESLSIPNQLDSQVTPLPLLGYAVNDKEPKGGEVLELSLWWRLDGSAAGDIPVLISIQDSSRSFKLYEGPPIPGYSGGEWQDKVILRGRYSLALPLDLSGSAKLLVEAQDQRVELTMLNIQPSGRTFAVPRIGHQREAHIGDSIKLLGYDIDRVTARPRQNLRLTLYWQALKPTLQNYTVFAHLLDPNGVLKGQQDSIPRNGELPTDRWAPGEVVVDVYEIPVAPDALPGKYQFEVGMYLPETGERVPMTDENGTRLESNRALIGQVSIEK